MSNSSKSIEDSENHSKYAKSSVLILASAGIKKWATLHIALSMLNQLAQPCRQGISLEVLQGGHLALHKYQP